MAATNSVAEAIRKDLKQVPTLPSNCTIYRVPEMLRKVKPEAYTPRLVSIGPFHSQKEHLKPMEAHKLQYLNEFLGRTSQVTLVDYVNAMTELEERVRKCYSEIINLKKDDLIKMLVIDGCFIVELFLRRDKWEQYRDDPILSKTWMSRTIMRDLILLENQLPLFVLQKLKILVNRGNAEVRANTLIELAELFFRGILLHQRPAKHHQNVSDLEKLAKNEESEDDPLGKKHFLDLLRHAHLPSTPMISENHGKFRRIHSATELHEAAHVKFSLGSQTCLFDITFSFETLKIPPIRIGDWTESLLRNLIAFEQCHSDCTKYMTAYATLMDGLIVSPKDVELLEKNGIIDNFIGRPEKVAELFNKLLEEVTIPLNDFYFSGVCEEVEKYYEMINASSMMGYRFNNSSGGFIQSLLQKLFSYTRKNNSPASEE
ncbi:UPF0481 protein At3g47200-like [Macadamia integrifolia]|uniref:UPF0481 protein At3g47200-like n=1 Tax=Macadamia integrifolia TaxID=60698 RepID=UPI001C5021E6|nr:UPF0481 protein At3g47200-like [Macadamia integrifolia]